MKQNKNKAEHNEQLEIPTLGFIVAGVTHMRRFKEQETKHQVLYDYFLPDSLGWFSWGGAIVNCVGRADDDAYRCIGNVKVRRCSQGDSNRSHTFMAENL